MRIYISGPISGAFEENRCAFAMVEEILRKEGHDPVNPHKVCQGVDGCWRDYMKRDIAALMDCDAITYLPGWENSRGARLECTIAREFGLATVPNVMNRW